MSEHNCKENDSCICEPHLYESNDNCPVHMSRPWPPRCVYCGKFINIEVSQ